MSTQPDNAYRVRMRVWGDVACFTQPPFKAERMSYPIAPPSAARGALEAVYWHPQFVFLVEEIHVLSPIQFGEAIMRNELKSKVSTPHFIQDDRTQRYTVPLIDVSYVFMARMVARQPDADMRKYLCMFNDRLAAGACYHTPYLGIKEFAADFAPVTGEERPIPVDRDLGNMLFEMSYSPDGPGRGKPVFFHAQLQQGVLRVPQGLYARVHGLSKAARSVADPTAPNRRQFASVPLKGRETAPMGGEDRREGRGAAQLERRIEALETTIEAQQREIELLKRQLSLQTRNGDAHLYPRVSVRQHGERTAPVGEHLSQSDDARGSVLDRATVGTAPGKQKAALLSIVARQLQSTNQMERALWYGFFQSLLHQEEQEAQVTRAGAARGRRHKRSRRASQAVPTGSAKGTGG